MTLLGPLDQAQFNESFPNKEQKRESVEAKGKGGESIKAARKRDDDEGKPNDDDAYLWLFSQRPT